MKWIVTKPSQGGTSPPRETARPTPKSLRCSLKREAEYEAYVALSKVLAGQVPAGNVYEPKYDWSTPMTLVTY